MNIIYWHCLYGCRPIISQSEIRFDAVRMFSLVGGLFAYWLVVSCAFAAPTVHLIKPEDDGYFARDSVFQQTELPQVVDPVWMTVTMKPLVKTTVVDPISKRLQPSIGTTIEQRPQQQQPVHYNPYPYHGNLPTVPVIAPNSPSLYPYHIPSYQYQQMKFPLQWSSVVSHPYPTFPQQHQFSSNNVIQPCDDSGVRNIGGGYQQYGY
ncbi:uncharacterized protein LOC129728986 [Wyeomyia smithii]|uniref:uncharacterized protein LOC129728986 n=1 Tax=Wyeomyia smithii TaxID=174621 RepID=UPI002467D92E|nr:uncharacterized protein LOC129728986 [Wyeomyia smithii]